MEVIEELLPSNSLNLGSIRNPTNSYLLLLENLIDFGKGVIGPARPHRRITRQWTIEGQVA